MRAVRGHPARRNIHIERRQDDGEPQARCLRSQLSGTKSIPHAFSYHAHCIFGPRVRRSYVSS